MASLRPTYSRADTDIVPATLDRLSTLKSDDTDLAYENRKYDSKDGILNEKSAVPMVDSLPSYDAEADDHFGQGDVVTTAKDLLTHILHVDDDPSLNPWTFRMFVLGEFIPVFLYRSIGTEPQSKIE